MKITKIEPQIKDPNRVSIYVDDKFAVGLDLNSLLTLDLAPNQEIDQQQLIKILSQGELGKLMDSGLRFVGFRPRSEYEIRRFLNRKLIAKDRIKSKTDSSVSKKEKDSGRVRLVDIVVDKLKSLGEVDDLEFAKWYKAQRQQFRPKGKMALNFELRRLGVSETTVKTVLNETGASEEELAIAAGSKKLSRLTGKYKGEELKQKLVAFLASRGFDFDTVYKVVDRLLKKE